MEPELQFIVEQDSLKSVLVAAGVQMPTSIPMCPVQVGDVIAYPAPSAVAVRVTRRWFRPGDEENPPRWYAHVEQVKHPLSVRHEPVQGS